MNKIRPLGGWTPTVQSIETSRAADLGKFLLWCSVDLLEKSCTALCLSLIIDYVSKLEPAPQEEATGSLPLPRYLTQARPYSLHSARPDQTAS